MPRLARDLALLLLIAFSFSGLTFAQRTLKFRAVNTQFEVELPEKELAATDAGLEAYVNQGATAVAKYFGHFPMKHVFINIRAVDGSRVRFGRSSPQNGGTIMLLVGRDAKSEAFNHDWTLTHEMVHLAFPATKGDNHEWLGEGMATYVEPIARAQSGFIPDTEVWRQFVDYMPRGLPKSSDGGIDTAHGIGRVYWGGGTFLSCRGPRDTETNAQSKESGRRFSRHHARRWNDGVGVGDRNHLRNRRQSHRNPSATKLLQ